MLKEGELDFERVLAFVGEGVFAKDRAGLGDLRSQRSINGSIAQRSAPRTAGNNCGVFAIREMAHAEDDNSFGKGDARENGSGDSTGINITGVRNEAGAIS